MTKYLVTSTSHYSENTPEYGCGDYPEQIPFLVCVVDAETTRKAQNAAKKQFPNLRFGGQFGQQLIEADDEYAQMYLKPADLRLSENIQDIHNAAIANFLISIKAGA